MKNVVVLGSTGSIGTSTIKVAEDLPQHIRLVGLGAGNNVDLLQEQAEKFKPEAIVELVGLVENQTISGSGAQQVFAEMFQTGKAPALIVQEKGLAQVSDTRAIEKLCEEVIAANPGPVADFKAGKVAALNFLKGQVMKLSKGKANPALAGSILESKLKG